MPYTEAHNQALYLLHDISQEFIYLTGVEPLAVAYRTGAGALAPPFEHVRTALSGWFRVLRFSFRRAGLPPVVPSREPVKPGEVLTFAQVAMSDPEEQPNGTRIYGLSGMYVFSQPEAPDLNGWTWPTGYLVTPSETDRTT